MDIEEEKERMDEPPAYKPLTDIVLFKALPIVFVLAIYVFMFLKILFLA